MSVRKENFIILSIILVVAVVVLMDVVSIAQNRPSCDWMYDKAYDLATNHWRSSSFNRASNVDDPDGSWKLESMMWSEMYLACREKEK